MKYFRFLAWGLAVGALLMTAGCDAIDEYTIPHYTMFLFDVSGSMAGLKIEEAREAVRLHIENLGPREQAGLRVFGWNECMETNLLAAPGRSSQADLALQVEALQAEGPTPLALGLRQAGEDLQFLEGRRGIVVFTDGGESCGGDPCAEARRLREMGIRVDMIAFDASDPTLLEQTQCVTQETGGVYFNITNPEDLSTLLDNLIGPLCQPSYVALMVLGVMGFCLLAVVIANALT